MLGLVGESGSGKSTVAGPTLHGLFGRKAGTDFLGSMLRARSQWEAMELGTALVRRHVAAIGHSVQCHRHAGLVRQGDQRRARIGDGGAAGFRDQAEIVAGTQWVEHLGDHLRRRVFIEFLDGDLLQWRYRGQRFEKDPGRLGVFCDEMR